ncbi:hypothetical protein PG997_011708 [Apiospora hydei]|uniref:Uncharacterized protein n=1 Tax=Apiospora hydei TaxID=1337664 RepID=A0ABR1VJW0_9PEZI
MEARPQDGHKNRINIYQFPSDLVNTLLRYIYAAGNSEMPPKPNPVRTFVQSPAGARNYLSLPLGTSGRRLWCELRHPRLGDQRVIANLYTMSLFFKMPQLGKALVIEAARHGCVIVACHAAGSHVLDKSQLGKLIETAQIASRWREDLSAGDRALDYVSGPPRPLRSHR